MKTAEVIHLTKICTKCNVEKSVIMYSKWRTVCKKCAGISVNEYRKRNPEACKARRKRYNSTAHTDLKVYAKFMVWEKRRKCKKLGIAFNLTVEDVIVPAYCPVLGIEIKRGNTDNAASIDRIKPNRGYVKGNIIIVSKLANQIRTNATSKQIRAVADFYERLGL